MQFRIISQNELYDCPYNEMVLYVSHNSNNGKFPIIASTPNGTLYTLGEYESRERARDILCDIRVKYDEYSSGDHTPWFVMPKT